MLKSNHLKHSSHRPLVHNGAGSDEPRVGLRRRQLRSSPVADGRGRREVSCDGGRQLQNGQRLSGRGVRPRGGENKVP